MQLIKEASVAIVVAGLLFGLTTHAHGQMPDFYNNTWHIYSCNHPDSASNNNLKDCEVANDPEELLVKGSFIHITPVTGNFVYLSMKLRENPDLQVFPASLESDLSGTEFGPGRLFRFSDDADPNQVQTKWLLIKLIRTPNSNNLGNKSCETWLEKFFENTGANPDTTVCARKSDNTFRNAIFWSISNAKPVSLSEEDIIDMMMPPGDGQGSGSDDIPP